MSVHIHDDLKIDIILLLFIYNIQYLTLLGLLPLTTVYIIHVKYTVIQMYCTLFTCTCSICSLIDSQMHIYMYNRSKHFVFVKQ